MVFLIEYPAASAREVASFIAPSKVYVIKRALGIVDI
jgi:hypothetical protein